MTLIFSDLRAQFVYATKGLLEPHKEILKSPLFRQMHKESPCIDEFVPQAKAGISYEWMQATKVANDAYNVSRRVYVSRNYGTKAYEVKHGHHYGANPTELFSKAEAEALIRDFTENKSSDSWYHVEQIAGSETASSQPETATT